MPKYGEKSVFDSRKTIFSCEPIPGWPVTTTARTYLGVSCNSWWSISYSLRTTRTSSFGSLSPSPDIHPNDEVILFQQMIPYLQVKLASPPCGRLNSARCSSDRFCRMRVGLNARKIARTRSRGPLLLGTGFLPGFCNGCTSRLGPGQAVNERWRWSWNGQIRTARTLLR